MPMLDSVLDHLRVLVAADTTNPPRVITCAHPAVAHVCDVLENSGFRVEIDDLGSGCLCILAVRGAPALLINCHLDTVPADAAWDGDPHGLRVEEGRAVGLGACDIKGALACQLAAVQASDGDAALLVTTDEEAGTSRCVRAFVGGGGCEPYEGVLVSEPTRCRLVTAHRGLVSAEVVFHGAGGHASGGGGASAVHALCAWGASCAADERLARHRFNLGRVEGGEKANMIASRATARFGMRPEPGTSVEDVMEMAKASAPPSCEWSVRFTGAALGGSAGGIARRLGVEPAPAVDFWTEAALFAESGLPAAVFGPGDIAQAHTAGEYVELSQLEEAARVYASVFARAKEGAAP